MRSKKMMIGIAAACLLCVTVAAGIFVYYKGASANRYEPVGIGKKEPDVHTTSLEGIDIAGLSREEAKNAFESQYPWAMKVSYKDQVYEVPNLAEPALEDLLDQIYKGEPQGEYSLDFSGAEQEAAGEAKKIADMWDTPAVNGELSGYDAQTDTFLFGDPVNGITVDQEKLAADISQALEQKTFDKTIEAVVTESSPEETGVGQASYRTLGTYTTKTTANKGRNINIDLASQAINGMILKPGEEFSFNEAVGQRTAKKGYYAASAYSNGEVVQEIGGGVCQVSTTLYNATVISGLEITNRKSHTFEPSYVTPGQDATVSWGGPDFKFRNNSSYPIGLRAHYADRTLTMSVFGVPILEEGVEYTLKSGKLSNLGVPAPNYVEDPTLLFGQEVVKSHGSSGSRWQTRLVVTKDGQVVSEDVLHTATYKGHTPVVARNSAAVPETPAVVETPPATEAPTGPVEIGPGITTAPAPTEAPQGPGVDATPAPEAPAPVPEGPAA